MKPWEGTAAGDPGIPIPEVTTSNGTPPPPRRARYEHYPHAPEGGFWQVCGCGTADRMAEGGAVRSSAAQLPRWFVHVTGAPPTSGCAGAGAASLREWVPRTRRRRSAPGAPRAPCAPPGASAPDALRARGQHRVRTVQAGASQGPHG